MTSVYETYTARMIARFGFRKCQAALCPRVVAGKHCLAFREHGRLCLCQRYGGTGILDHGRIWLTGPRQYLLTAEPYNLDAEEVATFRAEIAPLGLELEVTNESYWSPPSSRLVLIRRLGGNHDTR